MTDRIQTGEPLEDFFAGPGGKYVVVERNGRVYGPFHNHVVASYWRDDAGINGLVLAITHPWKTIPAQ